jgi:hypothetical protein
VAPEYAILVLRIALLAGLYLFLLVIVLVIVRDLGRGGQARQSAPRKLGRLIVVGADESLGLAAQEFALQPTTTIGRDPSCTVQVQDSFVSTAHALLTWKDGRWWLEDLGSTNGTQLNNRDVTVPTPVAYNDVVQVGRVRFKLTRD